MQISYLIILCWAQSLNDTKVDTSFTTDSFIFEMEKHHFCAFLKVFYYK